MGGGPLRAQGIASFGSPIESSQGWDFRALSPVDGVASEVVPAIARVQSGGQSAVRRFDPMGDLSTGGPI